MFVFVPIGGSCVVVRRTTISSVVDCLGVRRAEAETQQMGWIGRPKDSRQNRSPSEHDNGVRKGADSVVSNDSCVDRVRAARPS